MRPALNFHLTVTVLLVAIMATASSAFAVNLVMVTPLEMNFRTEPSADSAVVSDCPKLYSGMILTVYQEQGEWYYVEDMYGHKGWARAVYEGEVYLQDLRDYYLEFHISARTALDRAKPIALDWAEDAYAYEISASPGWNGLSDLWVIYFFAASKSKYYSYGSGYSGYNPILEVNICSDGDTADELAVKINDSIVGNVERPLPKSFLDSDLLFTPEMLAEYRKLPIGETLSWDYNIDNAEEACKRWFTDGDVTHLTLSSGEWKIENIFPQLAPSIVLDAVSGEILRVE